MTAEQAFDTPNYAATSARLADSSTAVGEQARAEQHDGKPAEQPKAIETPDQRATRERSATEAEVRAIREAYEALYRLSPAGLRRAFTWLHDRLESHGRDGTDPWEEQPF